MSILKDKAEALRVLAAKLEQIDALIAQIVITPYPQTIFDGKKPLAFGDTIYYDGNEYEPRLIVQSGFNGAVEIQCKSGTRTNTYASLADLERDVDSGRHYTRKPKQF